MVVIRKECPILYAMAVFSDSEIVAGLKTGQQVETITQHLYDRYYRTIKQLVFKNGGTQQDSEDLFQDVLLLFIEIISKGRYSADGEATIETYLYSIAYKVWVKRWKRTVRQAHWEQMFATTYQYVENIVLQYQDQLTAEQILSRLGEPCRTILYAFYVEGRSLEEIAVQLNSSKGAIKQQKFRCLNKLKDYYGRRE